MRGRRLVWLLPLLAVVAVSMVTTGTEVPVPTPRADQFRSFEPLTEPPTLRPTAGAMDVVPRVSVTPSPIPSPTPTPKPTPKPNLAGGPYKPWRTFNANVTAARAYALARIGKVQFRCLDVLWDRESRWRVHAENKSSGAYGIPQALPGRKMAWAGDDWRDNAVTQVKWGLHYIAGRYGAACVALRHSYDHGWY